MFGIGTGELLLFMVIALLVFGAKRLPEIGTAVGKGIRQFKRSLNEIERNFETESERSVAAAAAAPPPAEEPKKLSE